VAKCFPDGWNSMAEDPGPYREGGDGPVAAEQARPRIRVLIVEDHRLVAQGLERLLKETTDIEVVATVASKAELLETLPSLEAELVLMDFRLPDGSGAEAAITLQSKRPETAVLFLSADESEEALLAAVEAGACGYILKSGPASELVSAVRRAAAGEVLIPSQKLSGLVMRQRERARENAAQERRNKERTQLLGQLTNRERDVLELIAAGLDNKTIARRLAIGTGTVRAHVQHVLEKLGVHSKLEAAAEAAERDLVTRPDRG
jgi:DNA-binding NarL/FixJ family response regulator